MADKTLRVPAAAEPTFWNKDAVLGGAIGTLVPGIGLLTGVAGGVIGGFVGKSRMQAEVEHGKDVPPPSFWNRSIINGAALTELALAAVGIVLMIAGAIHPEIGGIAAHPHLIGGLSILGGTMAAGGAIGGLLGKSRMEKEYKEAQEYVAQYGEYQGKSQQVALAQDVAPQRVYTVTPEEMQALEARAAAQSQVSQVDRLQQAQPGVLQVS